MTIKAPKSKRSKEELAAAALFGGMGGRATAKKGKKHMSAIGKKGAAKRWGPKQ